MGPAPQPLSPRPTLQEHSTQQQLQQQRRQQAVDEAPQPQPVVPPAVQPGFADAQPPGPRRQQEAGDAAPGRSPRHGVANDWQQYSRSRQAASADSVLAPPADEPAVPVTVLSTQSLPVLTQRRRTATAAAAQEAGSGDALPPLVMPLAAATSLPLSVAGPEHADSQPGSPPTVNAVERDIGSGVPPQVQLQPSLSVADS
jgi:hypothetical protein